MPGFQKFVEREERRKERKVSRKEKIQPIVFPVGEIRIDDKIPGGALEAVRDLRSMLKNSKKDGEKNPYRDEWRSKQFVDVGQQMGQRKKRRNVTKESLFSSKKLSKDFAAKKSSAGLELFRASLPDYLVKVQQMPYTSGKNGVSKVKRGNASVKYVIRNVDSHISLNELGRELDNQGILWYHLVRFTKLEDGKKIPIPTVLVEEYGDVVPKRLILWKFKHFVWQYIEKPRMCFNCLQFGHSKVACESKAKCNKCSGGHKTNECMNSDILCIRCKGPHVASDRSCPKYIFESKILEVKCKNNISYYGAKMIVKRREKSCTQATKKQKYISLP